MSVKNNLNILVVEDSTTINSLIVESLRSLGYQAEGVFMGADALDLIAKNNYFTVLIDHVLPDMTGRDVINATLKVKGKVSFVVITGNGNERLAVELMKLGAVDYLVKDSNFIDLLPGVLDKVLKKYENEQLLISAQNKLEQQINDNQFLANLSLQLADPNGRHIVGDIALPLIKKHSGAIYAHFTAYNEDKKTFSIKHIETDNSLIRSIVSVGDEKILSKDYLVSDSLYHNLCENKFLQSNSLYKLTGGALPESVSKALKKVAGFKTLISIPQIHNGKLYGETTLAFSTAQDLPSAELLESFANILAVSLRNSLTETSLKQSEEMFRKLTENASDIIWTMDFNFNMQYVSPSVYNILGFAPKEYLKLTMEQKHPESTIDQFKLILQEEFEKEHSDSEKNRALGMKIEHYNAKGEIVWLALQLSFIRDSDDKPIGIHGISRDITKRRRAEETLRESETILTKTQEIAHIGSWKLDLITNKLIWSNEVYQIFGCQPQEFSATYEAFLDFVHPDDRAAVDEAYSRSLREGTDNYEIEHRIVRQGTGEVRYVHERCIHIRDNADTVIQSIGMVQDITERKRTEERLRQSEKKLRQVIDLVPHFIFAKDVYGTYLLANKAIADAYRTTPENMLGKSDYDFAQNTQEVDFFIKCDKKVIESGIGLYGIEEPMTDTEGSRRYFETSKIPFTTSDSKTPAVLAVSLDITERKQLELELAESAERFKALHNASFGGIAIHNNGLILECNQGLSDMTGYSLDELIGMNGMLLIATEHRNMVKHKIASGYEKPYEAIGLCKNGKQFPMRIEARIVPYKGKSVRTVEFRDITETKQAENKLKEAKLFLEKLLNTAPIPIFYKDKDGRYTGVNNSFEDFFGKTREELIGKSVFDINPTELARIYNAKDAELLNSIGTQIYESEVKTATGDNRDVVFHKASLVDNAECITGLVGAILDITERKRAEEALKKSEKHNRLLNKFLSEMLELPDAKSIYHYLAKSIQQNINESIVLCVSVDEDRNETILESVAGIDNSFIGKISKLAGFNPLGKRYELKKMHLEYFRKGCLVEFEGKLADFSSDQFSAKIAGLIEKLINLNGIHTMGVKKDGNVLAAVHIFALNDTAISDSQFVSSCVKQAALVLQQKIAEEKLSRSEQTLRLMDDEKNTFFQILAHDLRSPLGAIMGTSKLLRDRHNAYSAKKRQLFIDQLFNSASNTFNLLDELLLWSNSQAGNLSFKPQKINLASVISNLIETIKPLAASKEISIEISIAKSIVVLADKNMLSVILRNLVVNAIKFTNYRGLIQIGSAIDSNKVIISVSDNGVGMEHSVIDSIFKLNKKITTAGTNNEMGTGFGLKLCKEFIEKNGGKIWAESEVGKGSKLIFSLPLWNEKQNVKN